MMQYSTGYREGVRSTLTLVRIGVVIVALSYWVLCASDTLLSIGSDSASSVKIVGYVLMLSALLLRPRFHRLIILAIPLSASLLIGMFRTFNSSAGTDELLRFMFPVVITVSIYAYRDRIESLLYALVAIAITNDIFQCYFYLSYLTGLPLLLPVRLDSGVMLRAQGWIGFFSEFAFINFCAFIVCWQTGRSRMSKLLGYVFVVFSILAFSLKLTVVLALYPLLGRNWSTRLKIFLGIALTGLVLVETGALDSFLDITESKIALYLTQGDSARSESYRVMFESLSKGNFLGEGLGGFGGPASTKYNSPLYAKYNFNWFGMEGQIKTTDTFYPHLFVELGVFGGIVWLSFVLLYGQGRYKEKMWIYLVFAFCFDNVASMGFVSPAYVFSALTVMYALSRTRVGTRDSTVLSPAAD
jgi:hypothetical protein